VAQKSNFSILNKTRSRIPQLPFSEMKKAVLGEKYELSFVIVPEKTIHTLNRAYRNKNQSTDILSFPLTKNSGEIFMNPAQTKFMAKEFDETYEKFFGFLFIHGLFHLKGMEHGSTMEKAERSMCKKFSIE
jgi:probable rRNA maturation factor